MSDNFDPGLYRKHVKEAKLHVKLFIKHSTDALASRNKVADIAIKVRRYYKLVAFAEDIGINYQTLHSWMGERERPVKSIIKDEGKELDKGALRRTLKQLSKSDSPQKAQKIYNKEKQKTKEDIIMDNILYSMDDAMFRICDEFVLDKLNQEKLHTIYVASLSIANKLMDHFKYDEESSREHIQTS